jgi:endonuclease/exonuclease/phosphatase family metal-dependent hydrolase
MREILIDYINFEHGGRGPGADYFGDGDSYDFGGLVRIMSSGRWPHILGIGEADRWDFNGGEGAHQACAALRAAGGPPYVPLVGSLPRQGGEFAPAILYDPRLIQVHRWYCHRLPDFSARNRNLLIASIAGHPFRVVVIHGDINDGDMRLADAKMLARFAAPDIPCVIIGDWNSTPSGPWDIGDFNNPLHRPDRRAHKILFKHGPEQAGPHEADTRALDFLCGYWHEGRRIGGVGFYDVAEMAGDFTPTQLPIASGRPPRTIDRALVNQPWRQAYVRGSYRVHPPADPAHPDSDHLRISFAIQVPDRSADRAVEER